MPVPVTPKVKLRTLTTFPGGGGGIPDAPNDGTQYGRQSLAWTPIVGFSINALTVDTPVAGDFLPFYDVSGADTNKTTITALGSLLIAMGSSIPEAPNDGIKYTRRSLTWVSTPNITVSTVAPGSPAVNDVWIDTN